MMYTALALFAAVNGKVITAETPFLDAMKARNNLGLPCIKTDQCYFGSNPADCCDKHVIDSPLCASDFACGACTKAVGMLVGKLNTLSCDSLSSTSKTICSDIGLGDGNPMQNLCVEVVTGSCNAILGLVKKGTSDPAAVCAKIGFCKGEADEGVPGRVLGVKCGCVAAGSCTLHQDGCCSSKSSYGMPCVPPLSKCN